MKLTTKTFVTITMVIAMAFLVIACGKHKGYKHDKTGYYYKEHVVNKDTIKPKEGDAVVIDVAMRAGDSVFFSNVMPFLLNKEVNSFYEGDIYYAVSRMHVGDSISFLMNADSLLYHYFEDEFVFDVEDIQVDIKLMSIYITKEEIEEQEAQYAAQLEERKRLEVEEIASYIADNKIEVRPTESGLYFIETTTGKGKTPVPGNEVSVHYKGTFLDGRVFDTSIGKEPIVFQYGMGGLIPGFMEGISLMKEGGKATIIVPSNLAYGQGNQMIPPHTPLLFELELVTVTEQQ